MTSGLDKDDFYSKMKEMNTAIYKNMHKVETIAEEMQETYEGGDDQPPNVGKSVDIKQMRASMDFASQANSG